MKTDCLKKYLTAMPAMLLVVVFLFSGCTNIQTTLTGSNSPTPSPSPSLSSETPTQETVIPPRESVIKKVEESPGFVFKYGYLIDAPEGLFSYSRDDFVFLYLDEFKSEPPLSRPGKSCIDVTSVEDLAKKLIYLDFSDEEIEIMNRYMILTPAGYYPESLRAVMVPDPYLLLDFELSMPEGWVQANIVSLEGYGCNMYVRMENSNFCYELTFYRPERLFEKFGKETWMFEEFASSVEKIKDRFGAETAEEVEYHGMPATEFQCKDKKIYYQKYTVDGQTYCIIVEEDADGKILDADWGTTWKGNNICMNAYRIAPEVLEAFYGFRVGSKSE